MGKREFGEYYLGLDVGSNSVGWAATDLDYQLLRFNQKSMWGTRLFDKVDEANPAAVRRIARTQRRRIQRRNQRLALLQDLFQAEVAKVDPGFFQRLSEGMLREEDKSVRQKQTLFHDANYTDADYHRSYPTIYHLREALLTGDQAFDVRLVYLAVHHILKYRGHFLFAGESVDEVLDLGEQLRALAQTMEDEYDVRFVCEDVPQAEQLLKDRTIPMRRKQKQLERIFNAEDREQRQEKAWIKALTGATVKFSEMFPDVDVAGEEEQKVSFSKDNFDEKAPVWQALLGDRFALLDQLHAVYNWSVLADLLRGEKYLSSAKVRVYEKHGEDLKRLKRVIRRYADRETYRKMFSDANEPNNYCAYSGMAMKNGKKVPIKKRCQYDEFAKAVGKLLKPFPEDDDVRQIRQELEQNTFMPRIVSSDNGVIPNQLHCMELREILRRAARYLPFLNEQDADGLSVSDKVMQIMKFRIPYYVGPLNPASANSWVVRRSRERIYPWNFEQVVDTEASAEAFITRMTNNCTYLKNEDRADEQKVLPEDSILYSRFKVLNELNNLRICGEPISVELKQEIYRDLFEKRRQVKRAKLVEYLRQRGIHVSDEDIGGLNGDFKSSLKSEIAMKKALGPAYTEEMAEEILRLNAIFGDDRKLLRRRIDRSFGKVLSEEQIRAAMAVKSNGWGRLCAAFLTRIVHFDPEQERSYNIITALWETNENLMRLLSGAYTFQEQVNAWNAGGTDVDMDHRLVEDLYASAPVKRQIWQAMKVVREVVKITGHAPRRLFIEMARGEDERKEIKESRKRQLLALYERIQDEQRDWVTEIGNQWEERDFRRDALYLYYTQMGRCMYSGEPITLSDLFNRNLYDIEHIYPRSLVKDDSIDNRVLVKKQINQKKDNDYPLDAGIRNRFRDFWRLLNARGLISDAKLQRLLRTQGFSETEREGFIARQLVETRQSTKALADILKQVLPEAEIVYVKAGNVSEFRQKYEFVKVREINDLHHAKDAYLNIVVGNVYHTRFTADIRGFVQRNEHYNFRKMYEFNVQRGGCTAWLSGNSGTIVTVRRMMAKNNILVTKQVQARQGKLFYVKLDAKKSGLLPRKAGLPSELYGGYNHVNVSYLMLVEHTLKKKCCRTLVSVPIHLSAQLGDDEQKLLAYCRQQGYEEPKLLIKRILMNSLISVEGMLGRITAKSDDYLVLCNAQQLHFPVATEVYFKKIVRFCERAATAQKFHPDQPIQANAMDGITAEGNLAAYIALYEKLEKLHGRILSDLVKKLKEAQPAFQQQNMARQCYVLKQILRLWSASSRQTADLKDIGLTEQTGRIKVRSKISGYSEVHLIFQSVTGLFEEAVDLLKI